MIRRTIHKAYHAARPHAPQFLRYLLSGGTAAGLEILTVHLLSLAGLPPELSGPLSGIVGITAAFTLHKYIAFRARENTGRQSVRFAILTGANFVIQNILFILLVRHFGIHPTLSKILTIGLSTSWNFLLYKFFVYA